MPLAHSEFLMKCTCVQENHFRLKENFKIIEAFISHSMSLKKNFPACFRPNWALSLRKTNKTNYTQSSTFKHFNSTFEPNDRPSGSLRKEALT